MDGPVALILETLEIRYGDRLAVQGLSLIVRRGEMVGLLGPNGSGKSSILLAAAGLLDPVRGQIRVQGQTRVENPDGYARRVGLVPQEPALYEDLTAAANLTFVARLYGFSGHELRDRVQAGLAQVRLTDRAHDRVATFSGGLKQRLNLACALIHRPALLLLDEPTAALDPRSRDDLFHTLHELREQGHAVLFSTHHLDEVEQGCDRLVILDQGRLLAEGTPAELARPQPTGRVVLYAQMRERLPGFFVRGLRARLGSSCQIEVTGRRMRLSAESHEELGHAVARVLADGIVLETFRTAPGRLDRWLSGSHPSPQDTPCFDTV